MKKLEIQMEYKKKTEYKTKNGDYKNLYSNFEKYF